MRKKKTQSEELPIPPRSEAVTLKKYAYRGVVFYIDYYSDYPDESKRYGYCAFVDPPLETSGINTGPRFRSPGEAEKEARRDILMAQEYVEQ